MEKMALALKGLGCHHALVVHGHDNVDEITITGKTRICELKDGVIKNYSTSPEDFGIKSAPAETVQGETPLENADILRRVMEGEKTPRRDVVIMNAAAALLAGDRVETLGQGVVLAGEVIDSGKALEKLERLIEFSQSLA